MTTTTGKEFLTSMTGHGIKTVEQYVTQSGVRQALSDRGQHAYVCGSDIMSAIDVPGAEAVVDWFGYFPNFHDSEVESLELSKTPRASILKIHCWRTLQTTGNNGSFESDRHALVVFDIFDIVDIEITGWNHQNVLSKLTIEQHESGFELILDQSFGVEGRLIAKRISVKIEPIT